MWRAATQVLQVRVVVLVRHCNRCTELQLKETEAFGQCLTVINCLRPLCLVVNKSAGGDAVHVYERRDGWARISPAGSSERWVSAKLLCSGLGCYSPAPQRRTNDYQPTRSNYSDSSCPCSENRVCIGPRGGRYCITSGGRKRYGV